MNRNGYTVALLFDATDPLRLLMVLKDRTFNKGKFNGVGGMLEPHESWRECVLREIREETGANPIGDLIYLGYKDVKDRTGKPNTANTDCIVCFFAGVVSPKHVAQQPGETECLAWIPYTTTQSNPEFFAEDIPGIARGAFESYIKPKFVVGKA